MADNAGGRQRSEKHPIASDRDLSIAIANVRTWALAKGFDNGETTRIITSASEIGRNILKYAGHGYLEVQSVFRGMKPGIKVSAIDQGPGIMDLDKAMQDRFSTSGTLGLGLPGVKRLVDTFEIDSGPERGTRATFWLWKR